MKGYREILIAFILLVSLSLIPFSRAQTVEAVVLLPSMGVISYPETTGKLYVDGVMIKNPSGAPISLQGANVEPRDMNEEGMQWLTSRGFNYLRVDVFWHRFEPQQDSYSSTYFGYLDNLLDLCQEYGVYSNLVFMQWQWSPYFTYYSGSGTGFPEWVIADGNYEDSPEGLRDCVADFFMERNSHGSFMREQFFDFWTYIINRYKDNPYVVAYEVFNEPTIAKNVNHEAGVADAVMDTYEEFTTRFRPLDSESIHIYHDIGQGGTAERTVSDSNIVWTKSWYDVMWGGYNPTSGYSQVERKIEQLKSKYNDGLGSPFLISEMGFTINDENSGGAEDWIRDSFDVLSQAGLNGGYEGYGWFIYYEGTKYGFRTFRNNDGTNTWIVPVLQEYL